MKKTLTSNRGEQQMGHSLKKTRSRRFAGDLGLMWSKSQSWNCQSMGHRWRTVLPSRRVASSILCPTDKAGNHLEDCISHIASTMNFCREAKDGGRKYGWDGEWGLEFLEINEYLFFFCMIFFAGDSESDLKIRKSIVSKSSLTILEIDILEQIKIWTHS